MFIQDIYNLYYLQHYYTLTTSIFDLVKTPKLKKLGVYIMLY